MKTLMPVTTLPGVTPKIAEKLHRLGISTLGDLWVHQPLRYEDRTKIQICAELQVGETALIEGTLQATEITTGKKRTLVCLLSDGTAVVQLRFFHFYPAQYQQLQPGTKLRCFGEVRQGYHHLEIIHPEYQQIEGISSTSTLKVQTQLTPIYPSTEGLTQKQLRTLINYALQEYPIVDCFPANLLADLNLPTLPEALHTLHHPSPTEDLDRLHTHQHPAQKRLAFEELLAHHLSLYRLRCEVQQRTAPNLSSPGHLPQQLIAILPFQLTAAQKRIFLEIKADLNQSRPMQRLIQGDVGSGKTIVAALSALQAIEAGYQVAIMAPTELLAEQHYHTFTTWLTPFSLSIAWLTGSLTKKKREQTLAHIASGNAVLTIGTHALFQKGVNFAKLGLIIVDEQHRFGVQQRLALRNKGEQAGDYPHQLTMTATPIPRSLAMTAYADLDISTLNELPPGRSPVNTVVIPNTRRDEVMARIRHACQQGRQAYWVCTLIAESEVLQLQAAENTAQQLAAALPELQLGLIHGRLKVKDKEQIMHDFKAGRLHLLVATTVIEVGVDVPNASLMIIENAERLGLSQLHQLRGRIGRGSTQSYCVLLYQPPLSEIAATRLATIREVHDGFIIAQKDLEMRGPGEMLGTQQTGVVNLRVADLQRDQDLFPNITRLGKTLWDNHSDCCQQLIQRWIKEEVLHYGEV